MQRQFATHLATLAVGLSLGLGAVAVAGNQPTAHTSASDTRIVNELRTIERKLDLANRNLDGCATIVCDSISVKGYLKNIDRNIAGGR
jgi:hypothetical protein